MAHLIVLCEVPLDSRNGAGMRALIKVLDLLKYDKISSVHFGVLGTQAVRGEHPGVEYIELQKPVGLWERLRFLIRASQRLRGLALNHATVLVLPNSPEDLLLGVSALATGLKVNSWFLDSFIEASTQAKGPFIRFVYRKLFEVLYRRSSNRFVVSSAMARSFEEMFGREAEMIVGRLVSQSELVDSNITEKAAKDFRKPQVPSKTVRLAYVGSYGSQYLEPMRKIQSLLKRRPELQVQLDYFGQNSPPEEVLPSEIVVYRGRLADEELIPTLRSYDYGLLCYSFDASSISYMQLSFPSKLVDYMAAGLPLVALVPRELSVVADLESRNIGPLLCALDDEAMTTFFEALGNVSSADREAWKQNGQKWLKDSFTIENAIADFAKLMESELKQKVV